MINMQFNELSSGIRSVADIVKKADNLELYSMLIDLQAKAIELQEENQSLRTQLNERMRIDALRSRVIRHPQPYITLKNDANELFYCAHCWDSKEKLIQVNTESKSGEFTCPSCKNTGVYDQDVNDRFEESRRCSRGPRVSFI